MLCNMDNNSESNPPKGNANWLMFLGIVFIILGIIALGSLISTAFITIAILGWIIFIFGIAQLIQLFGSRRAGETLLHLLAAAFGIIIGLLVIFNPAANAAFFTTILAIFFVVIGIYRFIYGLSTRYPGRGWTIVSGIISFILGLILFAVGPVAGLTLIGLFIGIELIIYGISWVVTASEINRLPPP